MSIAISTLSEWTRRSEELYPQQLGSFYIINGNQYIPQYGNQCNEYGDHFSESSDASFVQRLEAVYESEHSKESQDIWIR